MNSNLNIKSECISSQRDLNPTLLKNSSNIFLRDLDHHNTDNFWTVDPYLFGEYYQLSDENGSHNINNPSNLSQLEVNKNCAINSSNVFSSPDEVAFTKSKSPVRENGESNNIFRKLNKKLYRKLPIHFIDTKDWQSYMELATIRNSSINNAFSFGTLNNGLPKIGRFKNNKVHRLLNSIFNLYQDYTELSEEYEKLYEQMSNKYVSSDSISSDNIEYITSKDSLQIVKKKNFKVTKTVVSKNAREMNLCEIFHPSCETIDDSTQTDQVLDWCELSESQLTDLAYNTDFNKSSIKWNFENNTSLKRNGTSATSEQLVIPAKSKRVKFYDHLTRKNFLGEQAIDITEELICSRIVISHKVNLILNSNKQTSRNSPDETSNNDFLNHPNFIFNSIATALRCATSKTGTNSNTSNSTLINLPIIMDLMLPKMQTKIRQIFDECSFLNNPLEIMAELRYFNYNKNATVEFFKTTRQLRSIIKEFINNSIDSRCRLVILRCLYRHYYFNEKGNHHKQGSLPSMYDNELCVNDNTIKENQYFDNDLLVPLNNEINHFKLANEYADSINSERVFLNKNSKSTFIEVKFFNNIHDSFSQTQCYDSNLHHEKLLIFAETINQNICFLKQSIKESKTQMLYLRRQVSSLLKALKNNIELIINLSSKHFMSDEHRNRIILLARQVEELKIKLKDEETKRRMVYNLMQEQMGNVRVYCRCRDVPYNENILEIQGNESIILPILPQEKFDFDKVFPSNVSQNDIYEEFRPLVMSFIDGFNVCFITYGSEASGKTYTLIGGNLEVENEHGIMQRALNTLLLEQNLRNRDWDYQITACVVEIYNDNCIDILSGESGIQLYVDCGMESVYQKLKSVPISNETDTEVLLQLCRAKRKVAKTALNPSSSRSHLITLIRLQGRSKIHGENIRSFMCLCDLAGFEDIIKAETQSNRTLSKEAGYINKSLTAFNRVFVSLRRQDPNTVCYRDTKLTHLLKPFLTNSGKCALVITVRTDRRSLSSTQNTLRFGRETRGVSLGKARRQININHQ